MTSAICGTVTSATITVTVDITPYTNVTDGSLVMGGKVCFDTKETDNVNNNGTLASRNPVDNNPTGTAAYPLTASGITITSVDMWEVTPSVTGLVASHNGASKLTTLTLTWEALATIRAAVPNSTRNATNIVITAYVTTSTGLKRKVSKTVYVHDFMCCGAMISNSQWKAFMCHNLGADQNADPFTPAAAINGDYYQWGYKYPSATRDAILGTPTTAAGNTYPSGKTWNSTTPTPGYYGNDTNGTDVKVKSVSDPCPAGYRVPSYAEWEGVRNNELNPRTSKGSWTTSTSSTTNYSGHMFGPALFLPAAGGRYTSTGSLYSRGYYGFYWSTRKTSSTGNAYFMYFDSSGTGYNDFTRSYGQSVRCITE
jgi:uncharacterized protein (TIGR02145 family)